MQSPEPSHLRHDPLSGDAVILAPGRSSRPKDAGDGDGDECPFCPGREDLTPPPVLELPAPGRAKGWAVRVVPNRYPIVAGPGRRGPDHGGSARHVGGAHEVVIETPEHDREMAARTPEELTLTLQAYRQRLASLRESPGVQYVSVFKNKGVEAGNSLVHPHSQIVALSYAPRGVVDRARRWRRFKTKTSQCLLCDAIKVERRESRRVIESDGNFLLYAPYASVIPAEMIVAPLQHLTSFAGLDDASLSGAGSMLHSALRRLTAVFDDPAYNLELQTWPGRRPEDDALHWYLRIVPRRGVLGGFELSTGDFVSTLTPEDAAAAYRGALS